MFDLKFAVIRTKLFTDKAQREGYPACKNQPDFMKKAVIIIGSQLWKKVGRRHETSMKMPIAQEMSTKTELKEKSLNIVAKLMGLNSLPLRQKNPAFKRNSQEINSHHCPLGAIQDRRHQQESNFNQMKYKDEYEVKNQLSSNDQMENGGDLTEKRMALVRQKFIEAKRLATDERLLRSKEFKDALDVLDSDKDVSLKLLEDPNFQFSNQLKDDLQQTASLGTQAECITTVLKPTTSTDIDHENPCTSGEEEIRDIAVRDLSSCFLTPKAETVSPPTGFVKALSAMPHEAQTNLASHIFLPVPERRNISENLRIDEDMRSCEEANEITHKIPTDSKRTLKDEFQRASILSNGYATDESSLDRFETDCKEGCSDCSDSLMVSSTSQNYLVYNRSESPGSLPSFSHASYPPQTSVSREGEKCLSELCESVISNDIVHGQEEFGKNSSTLGEMLAISEVKKQEEGTDRLAISSFGSCGQDAKSASIRTQKDEYQRASVFSNEYAADESSLGRSETDYREGCSDCNDSLLVSPASQNSLAHMRSESSGSMPSFSHASYSPPTSVSGEVEKRFLELCESVISNDIIHEVEEFIQISSILGEMFAIPEVKKHEEGTDRLAILPFGSFGQGHDMRRTSKCSPLDRIHECNEDSPPETFTSSEYPPASPYHESIREKEKNTRTLSSIPECNEESPKVFTSSESSPASTYHESIGTTCSPSDGIQECNEDSPEAFSSSESPPASPCHESIREKEKEKSSFKEKISSLFFSGMKKMKKMKKLKKLMRVKPSLSTSSLNGRLHSASSSAVKNDLPNSSLDRIFDEHASKTSEDKIFKHLYHISVRGTKKQRNASPKVNRSIEKLWKCEASRKSSNQPSHLSLSEMLILEDLYSNVSSSSQQALSRFPLNNSPLDPILLDEVLDRKGEEAKCRE